MHPISEKTNASNGRRLGAWALAGTALIVSAFVQSAGETAARADEVSPHGKGIVGGALLGGEVVTITESLVGVRNPWAYVIGGVVGAGGGGVAGYFVEQSSSDGRAPMYMLAGGLALIIPAVVLTLDATRYRPTEDATEDHAPTNAPAADPGRVGGSSVTGVTPGSAGDAPAATPPAAPGAGSTPTTAPPATPVTPAPGTTTTTTPPTSMLHLDTTKGELRFALPVPEVRPMYTVAEQRSLGLPSSSEVRMPLLRVRF